MKVNSGRLIWATSQAGKAELTEVGVTSKEWMMKHGTAGFGTGTFETFMAGALACAHIRVGMDLDS